MAAEIEAASGIPSTAVIGLPEVMGSHTILGGLGGIRLREEELGPGRRRTQPGLGQGVSPNPA